ncbi:MAG: putative holin [Pseudodesulfovibrio sp.]|nr:MULTISPECIES: putative holin [Pseudodesulfovibrio]MBV1766467.1 putative holin [Pseudodesulfovibrio sp.]MBV1772797.1 putative holin [Pseudodesulfovibrio sp.]MCG2732502.1 putative holin [Pseudodesulfovibrio aespoeensis]
MVLAYGHVYTVRAGGLVFVAPLAGPPAPHHLHNRKETTDMTAPRMTSIIIPALALLAVVALAAPQQLAVIAYKVALITIAGVAGYCLDRALFPYARPHEYIGPLRRLGPTAQPRLWVPCVVAQLRRAMIVAAAMLAVGLGL